MNESQIKNFEELMMLLANDIDVLSWSGRWEKEGGAISLSHMLSLLKKSLGMEKDALMLLASTYYGASGNIDSCDALKREQYLDQAYTYANKAYDEFRDIFTPSDFDVYASILRKKNKNKEALKIVEDALEIKNISTGQKALLLVGKLKSLIALNRRDDTRVLIDEIRSGDFDAKVRVRVLRSLAQCEANLGNPDEAHILLDEATVLAKANGLQDQMIKIQSVRGNLK